MQQWLILHALGFIVQQKLSTIARIIVYTHHYVAYKDCGLCATDGRGWQRGLGDEMLIYE